MRHIKVRGSRSPFDGDWSYWAKRTGRHPELPNHLAHLLKLQGGQCSYCGLYFELSNLLEVHHQDGDRHNHLRNNLTLLHQHCHDQVHRGVHDKYQIIVNTSTRIRDNMLSDAEKVGEWQAHIGRDRFTD